MKTQIKGMITGLAVTMFVCVFALADNAYAKKNYTENNMTYSIADEEATLTECKVEGDSVNVPAEVNGYKVTAIGNNAFADSTYKSISLPDTVLRIQYGAFSRCGELTSVKMPKNLEDIDIRAFSNCVKLKEIDLGDSLEFIPESAFYECINLRKVRLPKKLEQIGISAFEKCYKLENIKIGKNIKYIQERAFAKNYMLKSITLPKKLKELGDDAFYKCKRLKKVEFAGNGTKLGNGVFENCTELKKINLPGNMKDIPESLFKNSGLKTINIPAKVSIIKADAFKGCSDLKKIALNSKIYAIGDKAFADSGLTSLKLNDNMRYIGNSAFRGTKVKNISLPKKVTYIGNRVFANCASLTTIKIPASVKGINPGAFNNCVNLSSINVASDNKEYSSADGVLYNKNKTKLIQYPLNKKNASFVVPGSVDTIRSHAFEFNSNLKSLTTSAKNIGKFSFASMDNLRTVVLKNGVNNIGEGAFSADSDLASLTISDSVKVIGYRAFRGTGIKTAHIPSSLAKFDSNAFEECKELSEFTGGRGRKFRVSDGVLYNSNMTTLLIYPAKKSGETFTVPSSVKTLGKDALVNVSGIKELAIGKNIKKLAYGCINNCDNLRSVSFAEGAKPDSGYGAIAECGKLAVIVAPDRYVFRSMASSAGATLITL